ncbi:MAG: hypothetical protein F4018_14170 [Acidobacteria bacterium]|nr:hypothetical protein [Acidobacteriota bacterium]MYK89379.1 hypothetical protein [Acidobacteriota bacterium]
MPDPIQTTTLLLGTAASLAVVHTLLGVDHSLPFVALGRARQWTLGRTLLVTALCGAGHVASSVVIGAAGVGLGIATDALLWLESARGELAAGLLIGFGLAYAAWAVWRGFRSGNGVRPPRASAGADRVTPWALFIVFVLGPCEPLIPLMVVPGMARDWLAVAAVVGVFGLLTVGAMLLAVVAAWRGIALLGAGRVGRHADVAAGLVVAASGAAVLFLGL